MPVPHMPCFAEVAFIRDYFRHSGWKVRRAYRSAPFSTVTKHTYCIGLSSKYVFACGTTHIKTSAYKGLGTERTGIIVNPDGANVLFWCMNHSIESSTIKTSHQSSNDREPRPQACTRSCMARYIR